MRKVALESIEAEEIGTGSERRRLSESLETTDIACNQYRIAPGEGLPGGLHAHMDQEEVFVVLAGEAIFETLAGEIRVSEGEAIRFEPDEFQSGHNRSERELVVLAVGAPKETEDIRIPVSCPACGSESLRLDFDEGVSFVCPDCEAVHVPDDCPDCGHGVLEMSVDEEGNAVAVCQGCESMFDQPPLRE